ncbi:uncharacterized protein BO96DRAFT_101886 [Aspergillus niger CBS 101883]|uniref:Uncharacterized protein n=1 Tax=Aspergillus niger ATCC 13496 TaxID=1353008 RepID=A0A370BJE8_ASPNG|nr:uncharacterized protein BO96DRAFT_101886 [Aspergillus niger CBS 101883]PYH61647.1 hypothetical protein BO96DRAFT_101886 [Aspergillus niger CBS 101883]RDH15567.1 hypothetical protein M747DRAFT_130602 [Aspergillus niger ATCC 13496]
MGEGWEVRTWRNWRFEFCFCMTRLCFIIIIIFLSSSTLIYHFLLDYPLTIFSLREKITQFHRRYP